MSLRIMSTNLIKNLDFWMNDLIAITFQSVKTQYSKKLFANIKDIPG